MKKRVLITGSGGLVGSEAVKFYCESGCKVIGIDNDMRSYYFGTEGSTKSNIEEHIKKHENYQHFSVDIRDSQKISDIFQRFKFDLIIHAAAQPSHDWAASEPQTDFSVNANGTLLLLENFRKYSPDAVFIFTSTNKVYGDSPNKLPLIEEKTRFEIDSRHPYRNGITEDMPIDDSTHSLFGVSKAAADLMVQEYGRYFNLQTCVFRGGCLTGSEHAGVQQHGFLSYLVKSILTGKRYKIFGYKGKQVRDNIHAHDLINAFNDFYKKPRIGAVYNMGGSRFSNVSILEAIDKVEKISGRKAKVEYLSRNRTGDHIWYISSVEKFKSHYPTWKYEYDIDATIYDICKNSAFAKKLLLFSAPKNLEYWKEKNWYFHNSLKEVFKEAVVEGSKVLQIGYGLGGILSALFPKTAVSADDNLELLQVERNKYPYIKFIKTDPAKLSLKEKFDYVILPNSVNHFYDIQSVLEAAKKRMGSKSKLVITSLNPRWEQLFYLLEKFNLKIKERSRNWLRLEDLKNIIEISGYEVTSSGFSMLMPTYIPLFSNWINRASSHLGFFSRFCVEQFVMAIKDDKKVSSNLTCSVIIPCFNEEGNIKKCIMSVPRMGKKTEIIVVDDGSSDKTSRIVNLLTQKNKNLKLISYKPNHGKGYAVKAGLDSATGDIVMILDADMAVAPLELPRFFNVLASGRADFANGTRLIYPMEEQAMRQLNLIGNLFFSLIFSWILGQRVTDTLCGTKALLRKGYKKINMSGSSWGDFDLLFGAAENNLKIKEIPVHYKRRVAGKSKMKAFQHGLVLLKMCFVGFWRVKILMNLRHQVSGDSLKYGYQNIKVSYANRKLREKRGRKKVAEL